jgi:hypothetical protein
MKRKAQKAIRAKVQGMTRDEEVAFFRQGREEFDKKVVAAKQRVPRDRPPRQAEE